MTEVWASALFLAVAGLLVFGLGGPAFILQVSVPDEIRRVMRRWGIKGELVFLVLGILYCVILAILLLIYSREDAQLPAVLDWLIRFLALCAVAGTLVLWWHLMTREIEDYVLARLEKEACAKLNESGALVLEAIESIGSLGVLGTRSSDQTRSIAALRRIAGRVQELTSYDGIGLREVIEGLERIAAAERVSVGGGCIVEAAEALQEIRLAAQERGFSAANDARAAERSLGDLAVVAIRRGERANAMTVGEWLQEKEATFLSMIRAGVETGDFFVVVYGLQKLAAEVMRKGERRTWRAFVAGIACCSCVGGRAREVGVALFRKVLDGTGTSGDALIAEARAALAKTCEFTAVDEVDKLQELWSRGSEESKRFG